MFDTCPRFAELPSAAGTFTFKEMVLPSGWLTLEARAAGDGVVERFGPGLSLSLGAFFLERLSWFFKALAAAFASLRVCLANFLACLCALRASFNLAFANRANFRAVSACFWASAALAARAAAPLLLAPALLELFILFSVPLIGGAANQKVCCSICYEPVTPAR
jgi:hypothetical protein